MCSTRKEPKESRSVGKEAVCRDIGDFLVHAYAGTCSPCVVILKHASSLESAWGTCQSHLI